MTVTLTYDAVLSRIQITANALAAADYATVERSIDQIIWSAVRGGLAVPLTGGSLVLPGTAGNYASTPDNAALDIVADIDLRADVALADWTPAGNVALVSKFAAAPQSSYMLSVEAVTGKLRILTSVDGTALNSMVSTVAVPASDGSRMAVRATLDVDNGAAGKTATFYTAPTLAGPWTQLGAAVTTGGTTSIFAGTAPLEVGSHTGGTANLWAGIVHGAEVRAGIGGTVVAAPDFKSQPAGTVSFTDGAARVWTVNGTATIPTRAFAATVDDYEFTSGVANFYRVRGFDDTAIGFVSVGAAATAVNASVTPALPDGLVAGDAMVALASIRNSGVGTVNVPAGWSTIRAFGNVALLGKRFAVGDTAPVITFAGGVANADTIGQVAALRRASIEALTGVDQLNASGQDIAFPGLTITEDGCAVLVAGWKQDDWTSVAALAGMAEIGEPDTTTGDDAGQVWDYLLQTVAANIIAGSLVVTGGAAAISRSAVVALPHAEYLNEQTANTTPVLDTIWIKSIVRPFLNRRVTVTGWSDIARGDRGAQFDVVGRTLPIAVTDVGGTATFTLELYAATHDDAQTLDYILASGDVLFLHTPAGCELPSAYLRVAGSSARRPHVRASSRVFSLPVIEVAAPGPDVVGATSTWQTVLNSYPTWAAVLAANATWADLLARIAPPSEVIVP